MVTNESDDSHDFKSFKFSHHLGRKVSQPFQKLQMSLLIIQSVKDNHGKHIKSSEDGTLKNAP